MTPSEIFSIANKTVMPMWLLLIFLPKWKATRFLIDYKIVPIALSIIYAIYITLSINGDGFPNFGSLSSVMNLFTMENAVIAGWVHYLAFDLLIGMWMINKNRDIGIHPIIMAPILLGTFMFGPIGFLLFIIARSIKTN